MLLFIENRRNTQLARAHEKVANQRSGMLHKRSTAIVRRYDALAIEDLQVTNMARNHKLAMSMADAP